MIADPPDWLGVAALALVIVGVACVFLYVLVVCLIDAFRGRARR